MRSTVLMVCFLLVAFIAVPMTAMAQADDKQGPTEESLDSLLKNKPKPKPKADEPAPVQPEKPKAEVMAFPEDTRNIKASISMKNGKKYSGTVKYFLISDKIDDHMQDPSFGLCDGPTVRYERDEFNMNWGDISKIVFNKRNKENGEMSCVEVSDVSPDRLECLMTNEFAAYAKDKKKKGQHIILNKEVFRFVLKTSKGDVNVDSHLGKVKINNSSDEQRREKDLVKEMKDVFANEIMSITFR